MAEETVDRARDDLLNRLVRWFDGVQRRRLGIWEFSQEPDCIFRLGRGHMHQTITFPDGTTVAEGAPVAVLHVWGERMPPIPPEGADLAWARGLRADILFSLRLIARAMMEDPRLADVEALGNDTNLPVAAGGVRMFERLGFTFFAPLERRTPVERIVGWGAHTWAWLLRRAYNQKSAERWSPSDFVTRPMWIGRRALLERYLEETPARR